MPTLHAPNTIIFHELSSGQQIFVKKSVYKAPPKLVDGPHKYTETMKGSALFACRHAAKEVLSNQPGKWVAILTLYLNGVWPCGITQTGELVIL